MSTTATTPHLLRRLSSTTRAGVITAAVLGTVLFLLLAAFAIFWWKGRGMVDRRRAVTQSRRDAERQVDTVTPYEFGPSTSTSAARGHDAASLSSPQATRQVSRPPSSAYSCAVHDECSAALARAKDANMVPNRIAVGTGYARPSPAPSMRSGGGASPVAFRRDGPEVQAATPGAALDLGLAAEQQYAKSHHKRASAPPSVPVVRAHTAAGDAAAVRPRGPTRGYAYSPTSQRGHQRALSDEYGVSPLGGDGGLGGQPGTGLGGLGLDLAVPYDVHVIPPPGVPGSPSTTGGGAYMEWAPSRPASALGTPKHPLPLPAITTRHPGHRSGAAQSRSSSMSSSSVSLSPTPVTPTLAGGGLGRVPSAQSMAGLSSRDKMLALYEASHHSAAGTQLQSQSVRSLPLSS